MHEETTESACRVCGADGPPRTLYVKRGFPIVRCAQCGLVSTRIAADFDPTTLYDASYFDGSQHDGYVDYAGSEALLREEFRGTLAALRRHGARHGRLFELGCAYGFFLLEAAAHFDVCGAELAVDAVESCRARGLDVHTSLEAAGVGESSLDAWVMLDVIEHLEHPDQVLAEAHRRLRPGGSLILTTGDAGSLTARLLGRRWRLMTPPQHLFFFDTRTIRRLLERQGFRVVRIEHPWKKVPLQLAAFQLGRALGSQRFARHVPASWGVPVNLFDAMRVIAERR